MRRINKSPEPESLTRMKRERHNNRWDYMHEHHREVYGDIMDTCRRDQHDLCGYTEVKLQGDVHIDHFIKRDIDPGCTFDWLNMIAAVHDSRFGADFKDETVTRTDYDVRQRKYLHVINPVTDELEGRFRYCTDGTMEPASGDDEDAAETIRVFNLNENSLAERRKETMQAVRDLMNGGMEKEEVLAYAGEEFISAVEYEILENTRAYED